ncbi:MAG: hypothetical protein EB101_10125, partial [Chitinophagia bacterium]|nr:hypothetical protein [Chitinophagia bacterium]
RKLSKVGLLALFLGSLNFISAPSACAAPVHSFTEATTLQVNPKDPYGMVRLRKFPRFELMARYL